MRDWAAFEAEVARIIAENPEPIATDTKDQVSDFLTFIRGRTPIPNDVGVNRYRSSLCISWDRLEFELYGDHLEIYRYGNPAIDIRHVPHMAGEPFPAEVEAALPLG